MMKVDWKFYGKTNWFLLSDGLGKTAKAFE